MTMTSQDPQTNRLKQILRQLSKAYLERHQFPEAMEKLSQLVKLEPDDPEVMQNIAIANIGLQETSENALQLYEHALKLNPHAKALKLGLATLFSEQGITNPFAVQICEEAITQSPPNEKKIRQFLQDYYEKAGKVGEARKHQNSLMILQYDSEKFYQHLEALWLEEKFDEAREILQIARGKNGTVPENDLYMALTEIYRLLNSESQTLPRQSLQLIQNVRERLNPAKSFQELHHYLLLASLPEEVNAAVGTNSEIEEYQLILNDLPLEDIFKSLSEDLPRQVDEQQPFQLHKDLLNRLKTPDSSSAKLAKASMPWQSFLFAHISGNEKTDIPEKLFSLASSHLTKVQNSITRMAGNGIISLAVDPLAQFSGMLNLLKHVESYNASVPQNKRVKFITAMKITQKKPKSDREVLLHLMDTSHLWQLARHKIKTAYAGGPFILQGEQDWLTKHAAQIGPYQMHGPVRYMPGKNIRYMEIIWHNPLENLGENESYRIHHFEIQKCIRNHNRYRTYYGLNTQLDRPVIVKVLPPRDAIPILQEKHLREQFFANLQAIGRINSPQIATLYDIGEYNSMLYFVREYIEGTFLSEAKLAENNREQEVLQILQKVVRGLQAAQREGVAHLNMKPSNIWISEANEIKITDFHCLGLSSDAKGGEVLFPAQWRYAAPEILSGEPGDHRSDIYSLGIIAYELLSGIHPYDTTVAIKSPKDLYRAKIDPIDKYLQENQKNWPGLVMKALATEPENRYQSLVEVEKDLRQIHLQLLQQSIEFTQEQNQS